MLSFFTTENFRVSHFLFDLWDTYVRGLKVTQLKNAEGEHGREINIINLYLLLWRHLIYFLNILTAQYDGQILKFSYLNK